MERWPALYLLFTPELCTGDPWHVLQQAIAGGVGLVQWRVPQRDEPGLQRCLSICTAQHVPVVVNDDVELALRSGAAGAHVGQTDLPAAQARALLGPDRLLGVSTHDPAQLAAAVAAGADYAGFGPCFATATKGYTQGLTPELRARGFAAARLPVYAIGGITSERARLLHAEGARRIAVTSAILAAPDPRAAAAELRAAIEG